MKSLSIAGSGCKINLVDANLSLSQPLLLATLPNPTKSFETDNFLSFSFLFLGYRMTPVEARVRAKERTKPVSTRNDDTCSQGLSASVGLSRSIGFSLGASLPAGPIRKFHAALDCFLNYTLILNLLQWSTEYRYSLGREDVKFRSVLSLL